MPKAVLRYFTGTGNCWRALTACKKALEGAGYAVEMSSINKAVAIPADADCYGFCFPVISLGVPRVVRKYLAALPALPSPQRAFVLVTGGNADNCGWALLDCEALLKDKGYRVVNADLVQMPENWPYMEIPAGDDAERIASAGEAKAADIARKFLAGTEYHKPLNLKVFGRVPSRVIYLMFKHIAVNRMWSLFRVDKKLCNGCGLCARHCPAHAIRLDGKKIPRWGKSCEQCMRCVNFCAKNAIRQPFMKKDKLQYRAAGFNPERDG